MSEALFQGHKKWGKKGFGFFVDLFMYISFLIVVILFFVFFNPKPDEQISTLGHLTSGTGIATRLTTVLKTPVMVEGKSMLFADLIILAAEDPINYEQELFATYWNNSLFYNEGSFDYLLTFVLNIETEQGTKIFEQTYYSPRLSHVVGFKADSGRTGFVFIGESIAKLPSKTKGDLIITYQAFKALDEFPLPANYKDLTPLDTQAQGSSISTGSPLSSSKSSAVQTTESKIKGTHGI